MYDILYKRRNNKNNNNNNNYNTTNILFIYLLYNNNNKQKINIVVIFATPVGLEPTRAMPNGLAGHRLNHSAKVPNFFFLSPTRGIEPLGSA